MGERKGLCPLRSPTEDMYLSARGGRKVPKERHQRAHALWKPMWPLCCFLTEHIHGDVSQYSLRKYLRRRTLRNAAKLNPRQMRGHSCRYLLSCAATQGRHASDALPTGGSRGASVCRRNPSRQKSTAPHTKRVTTERWSSLRRHLGWPSDGDMDARSARRRAAGAQIRKIDP